VRCLPELDHKFAPIVEVEEDRIRFSLLTFLRMIFRSQYDWLGRKHRFTCSAARQGSPD